MCKERRGETQLALVPVVDWFSLMNRDYLSDEDLASPLVNSIGIGVRCEVLGPGAGAGFPPDQPDILLH